jgi:hypothetical protein
MRETPLTVILLVGLSAPLFAGGQYEADLAWESRHKGVEGAAAPQAGIRAAIDLYARALEATGDVDVQVQILWKLMRCHHYLGRFTDAQASERAAARRRQLELGERGMALLQRQYDFKADDPPEAIARKIHRDADALQVFLWQAFGWDELARNLEPWQVVRQGIPGRIRHLATVCALVDRDAVDRAPDRLLGRWAGSEGEAEERLRSTQRPSLKEPLNHLDLAELLVDRGRPEEAVQILDALLKTEPRSKCPVEDRAALELARALLASTKG